MTHLIVVDCITKPFVITRIQGTTKVGAVSQVCWHINIKAALSIITASEKHKPCVTVETKKHPPPNTNHDKQPVFHSTKKKRRTSTQPLAKPTCEELKEARKIQKTRGNVYNLSFDMYLLYTWCTREWCNLFGPTPNCRDSRINHMFRNTFPMRDNLIIPLSLEDQGKCVQPQLWYGYRISVRLRLFFVDLLQVTFFPFK